MSSHPVEYDISLPADFADRLEEALEGADRSRRKRAWYRRVLALLPVVLLVGPIVGWRLMGSTPDGVHVVIAALAWVTFLLDVGVHVDTSMLSYLGLTQLPTIVGGLILIVLTVWLLSEKGGDQ
jgi:hypothetical protein